MCRVETPLDARGSSASRLLIPSAGGCRATTRRGSASSVIGLSQRQKSRGRKSAVKLANDLDYWGKARQSRAFQPHFHPSARGCYFTTPPPPSRQLLNDRLSNATAAGPLSVEPSKGQTLLFVLAAARRLVTMFELRSRGFRGPLLGQPFYGWTCALHTRWLFPVLGRLRRQTRACVARTWCLSSVRVLRLPRCHDKARSAARNVLPGTWCGLYAGHIVNRGSFLMMLSDWVEEVVEAAPQGPLSPRGDNGATRFWRTSKRPSSSVENHTR